MVLSATRRCARRIPQQRSAPPDSLFEASATTEVRSLAQRGISRQRQQRFEPSHEVDCQMIRFRRAQRDEQEGDTKRSAESNWTLGVEV